MDRYRYRIYTDGACAGNPGPAGYGVVVAKIEGNKYKPTYTFGGNTLVSTNNRMELTAAIEALKYAVRLKLQALDSEVHVELISDSAYVINVLKNDWLGIWRYNGWKTKSGGDVKNKDLWQQMLALRHIADDSLNSLKFTHCDGHSGVIMNEMADAEAVRQRKLVSAEE
jgi:ribonuclease HI